MNYRRLLKRRIGALIALSSVSAIMLAASCGEDDNDKARPSAPEAGARPAEARRVAKPDDGGLHRESQAVHVLITVNTGEVEQGSVAQKKASSDSVKDYAAMMIAEHRAANDRLAALAEQKKITPEANPTSDVLKSEVDTVKGRLDPLTGPLFDKSYIEAQIVMHMKVRAIIDEVLTPTMVDPDLKGALADFRRSVEAHLLKAEGIRRDLGLDASVTVQSDASSIVTGNVPQLDAGNVPGLDSGLNVPGLDSGLNVPGFDSGLNVPGFDSGLGGLLRDGGAGFDFQ